MNEIVTPKVLRAIEECLSEPKFHGMAIGPTLNDHLITHLYNKRHDFSIRNRLTMRALMLYHAVLFHLPRRKVPLPSGRPVLVTCISSRDCIKKMMIPVINKLGVGKCVILRSGPTFCNDMEQFAQIDWNEVSPGYHTRWVKEYLKCKPQWQRSINNMCDDYGLPQGTWELLALRIMVNTQNIIACMDMLTELKPSVVVTEYDRYSLWSCLVLAAKSMKIPTITLVHGVMNENAVGYFPVIADKILCWGNLQKNTLINEGVLPDRIDTVGCPRLTRDLSMTAQEAKLIMGLNPEIPAVMLGTSPTSPEKTRKIAGTFCAACSKSDKWSAFVRLHPSESIDAYSAVSRNYPNIHFYENGTFPLEISLAASNVMVVEDSGIGSDALIKRKSTIVLSPGEQPKGHGAELVEKAGCPLARTEKDLFQLVTRLVFDQTAKGVCKEAAEKYVRQFCSEYGNDSAIKISNIVNEIVEKEKYDIAKRNNRI